MTKNFNRGEKMMIENMYEKIIPFRKYDRYPLTRGFRNHDGQVIEKDAVGFAFLKPGSKMFRLKIWVFPQENYFLAQSEAGTLTQYQVLALEEYQASDGETKTNWNKVGEGSLVGNLIHIRIQFFADDIFLCLFPENPDAKDNLIAL